MADDEDDDSDDKVRRNLLVFSAAVLLVEWLGMPIDRLLDKLAVGHSAADWRAWLAALVALAYLGLRYRFSRYAEQLAEGIKRAYGGRRFTGILRRVCVVAKRDFLAGQRSPLFGDQLQQSHHELAAMMGGQFPPAHRIKVDASQLTRGDLPWTGEVNLVVQASTDDGPMHVGRTFKVQYTVPRLARLPIMLAAFFRSWVYSDASVNFLAPIIVGLCAAAVILYHLAAYAIGR